MSVVLQAILRFGTDKILNKSDTMQVDTQYKFLMTQHDSEWYRSFFEQDYLDVYGDLLTADRSESEAEFVRSALGLRRGDKILDLCCGPGRHSIPLAKKGMSVTGLDMSESYLDLACSAADQAGVDVHFVQADMRDIPHQREFDAVINMFTAFGYFPDEADDQRVLHGAARALKPGGHILLDLLNRDWVAANYVRSETRSGTDGTVYREEREFDSISGRNHVEFTIISPDGSQRTAGHHIRLYVATEMSRMLEKAGMVLERTYGDYTGRAMSVDTRRMILVARKLQV